LSDEFEPPWRLGIDVNIASALRSIERSGADMRSSAVMRGWWTGSQRWRYVDSAASPSKTASRWCSASRRVTVVLPAPVPPPIQRTWAKSEGSGMSPR
jgi:hypothetical protein